MAVVVRKVVSHVEETWRDAGETLPTPRKTAIVAALIENPYPIGYSPDVSAIADDICEEIGRLVGPKVVELLDGHVEAFGKAVLVGIDGELEQGSALIHNLRFGNVFREAAGGTELLPAAEKCGPVGASIDIPLKHKTDAKIRSHHQTVTLQVADGPLPREILIACAGADGGRPLARLGKFGAELAEGPAR